MIPRVLFRHIVPVALTTLSLFTLWVLGTLPMFAVAVLDSAFVPSDYIKFLFYVFGVAVGLSTVVLLPLALLGEWLAKRSKHAIWVFPALLCLCTVTILIIRTMILRSFVDAALSWSGLILLVSGLFVLYWVALWIERVVARYWQKLRSVLSAN